MRNDLILAYCIYLPVTVILTVWVASTLFRNGRIFLLDIFHNNTQLADSVNKLLLVGFYLVNIGYAVYTMTIYHAIYSSQALFEVLSKKVGLIILVLGFWHFLNMYLLFRGKKRSHKNYIEQLRIREMEKKIEG